MKPLTKRGATRKRVPHGAPLADRIKLHARPDENGCWIWTAAVDKRSGYGRLTVNKSVGYAHRVSYEAFVGPIPEGLQIDHLCRVRACCNPDHLEAVTPLVNQRRAPSYKGAISECPYGHPYSDENTYRYEGHRGCITCRTAYLAIWRALPHEEAMRRKRSGLPVVDLAAYFADQTQERAA